MGADQCLPTTHIVLKLFIQLRRVMHSQESQCHMAGRFRYVTKLRVNNLNPVTDSTPLPKALPDPTARSPFPFPTKHQRYIVPNQHPHELRSELTIQRDLSRSKATEVLKVKPISVVVLVRQGTLQNASSGRGSPSVTRAMVVCGLNGDCGDDQPAYGEAPGIDEGPAGSGLADRPFDIRRGQGRPRFLCELLETSRTTE